jgi:hypothetical protein
VTFTDDVASGMHEPMRAVVVIALCFSAVVACPAPTPPIDVGEGEGEGEGEDGAFLPATSYCEALADVFCPFYLRCGRLAGASDIEGCRAAFAVGCEAAFEPRFLPLADAGLMQLSRAGLDACATHLDDVACTGQFFELEGPCAGIWEGTVPAGGACGLDAETFVCAPGTACTLDLSFCGTCENVLDVGATCRVGDEGVAGACGPRAECGDDDVCVDRPDVGEACVEGGTPCTLPARCSDGVCRHPAIVAVGEACDSQRRCPYGARCADGVCVASTSQGGSCAASFECDTGLFCGGGVCAPVVVEGACVVDEQCASGTCEQGACAPFAPRCTTPSP